MDHERGILDIQAFCILDCQFCDGQVSITVITMLVYSGAACLPGHKSFAQSAQLSGDVDKRNVISK